MRLRCRLVFEKTSICGSKVAPCVLEIDREAYRAASPKRKAA
jgi:hypothetical protein